MNKPRKTDNAQAAAPSDDTNPWRLQRRMVDRRRVFLVVRGSGASVRYITNNSGWPKEFSLEGARAAIARRLAADKCLPEPHTNTHEVAA